MEVILNSPNYVLPTNITNRRKQHQVLLLLACKISIARKKIAEL